MTHKALLVDDDPKICESVSEILASLGHEHQQAHSQEAARALLAQGEYSYILLDLEIPVRDGGGFARLVNGENLLSEIRKMPKMRGVPVIVMTGFGSTGPSLAVRLMKKGAEDFVNKPFNGAELDQAILDAMARKDHKKLVKAVTGVEVLDTGTDRWAHDVSTSQADATATGWLTVSEAARLLMKDVPGLDMNAAKARVSWAAGKGAFATNNQKGRRRRISQDSFSTWRLTQRDKDLDAEDADDAETSD